MILLAALALSGATARPAAAAVGAGSLVGSSDPIGSITGLAGNLLNPAPGAGNPLSNAASAATSLALGVFASGVLGGAGSALRETAHVISRTTGPRLQSTWFSATYWRVAGLAAVLSLPFLFAAAVQALLRADPMLLVRSVFGFLPLAILAVNLAAPITMLLLSASDQMSAVIAGTGVDGGVHFLQQTAQEVAGLSALDGSPFLAIAIGLLTLAAAVALAVEMLIREAAVYVVVLMLPLAFAALIWPARRGWAVRLVELLIALILSKFVIVAVLSLAGAAYGSSGSPTATRLLTAMTLVMLSTFAPWVMLRLLPFTELAAGAAGGIRGELPRLARVPHDARAAADTVAGWVESLPNLLRRQAGEPGSEDSSPVSAEPAANEATAPIEHLSAQPGGPDETGGAAPEGELSVAPDGAAASPRTAGSVKPERHPGMEPVWQFEDLTPSWISLDGEGVRRLAGPDLAGPDPAVPDTAGPDPAVPDPADLARDDPE
jgi:hypothetical protein